MPYRDYAAEGWGIEDCYPEKIDDGKPCGHPGCLNHVSHPCEGCGRVAGRYVSTPARKDEDD